jgi:hypothetical protein
MKTLGAETASIYEYLPVITRRSCLTTLIAICLYSGTTVCSGLLVENDSPQLLLAQNLASISFSDEWQLLGPFQCGTRGSCRFQAPLAESQPQTSRKLRADLTAISQRLSGVPIPWNLMVVFIAFLLMQMQASTAR